MERYDTAWGHVLTVAKARIDAGENSLSRVLRQVEAEWRSTSGLKPVGGAALGNAIEMPMAALIGARQALWRQVLIDACRPDTSLIVEIGSGWGQNLLDLYLGGGPRRATYFALEPSQSGRTCFSLLASLEPALTARSAAYDYSQPCYEDVPRGHAHALIFTSHSIEPEPELNREVLTELFPLASELTVVHFEPVGWQIRAERGLEAARVGATKEYSEAKKYNRNLWELLVDLEKLGRIDLLTADPDIFCHKRFNVSSLIIWAPRKSIDEERSPSPR
jgi:hypothetical protein